MVASGSASNALIRRAGATSEMESSVSLEQLKVIEDTVGVARGASGPLVSPEVVVIAPFGLKNDPLVDANVQVRGVSPKVLDVRNNVKIVSGRMFAPGLNEMVIGRNVSEAYSGFSVGATKILHGEHWTVVGIFDAGGSAFDSEIWCDETILNPIYQRPATAYQVATVHLNSPNDFQRFKDALSADPRMTVQVDREIDYYAKQSRAFTTLVEYLGGAVAVIMGIGAIFGALNTMYSAVAERSREIATMRALGFGAMAVVVSFVFEAICIAFMGGLIGCVAVLPLNGFTTGTMNWQTFSHMAFAFQVTPALLAVGLIFAVLMGILGGVPPAVRAARSTIAVALREL